MRNMSEPAPIPKSEKEKTECINMANEKYITGEYAREHFVRSAGVRYRTNTNFVNSFSDIWIVLF
jgi:hypothetical protein